MAGGVETAGIILAAPRVVLDDGLSPYANGVQIMRSW